MLSDRGMSRSDLTPIELHPMSDRITSDYLVILADAPGPGGASHNYVVQAKPGSSRTDPGVVASVHFQTGPLQEAGLNGCSTMTLMQVLIHHLQQFQSGPFPSRENALSITNLEEALHWQKQRELARAARGVLGKSEA